MTGARFAAETAEAPAVVSRLARSAVPVLQALVAGAAARPVRHVVFVARGSSDNACIYGRYLIETTARIPAGFAAPSVVAAWNAPPDLSQALVIAVSQSGRSPDVAGYVEAAAGAGALTLAVVNDPHSPAARAAELVLELDAGEERAVAAGKTYTASLAALALTAAALADDSSLHRAVAGLEGPLTAALDDPPALLARAERYAYAPRAVVLGRGLDLASAHETALKLMEAARWPAQAFSPADYLHGPVVLTEPRLPIIAFAGRPPTAAGTAETLRALAARGAELTVFGDDVGSGATIPLPAVADDRTLPIVAAVRAQRFALACARARGLDPDAPPGLQKITLTR